MGRHFSFLRELLAHVKFHTCLLGQHGIARRDVGGQALPRGTKAAREQCGGEAAVRQLKKLPRMYHALHAQNDERRGYHPQKSEDEGSVQAIQPKAASQASRKGKHPADEEE